MATQQITLTRSSQGYRANPDPSRAQAGDDVRIKNRTGSDVYIGFCQGNEEATPFEETPPYFIGDNQDETYRVGAHASGTYTYDIEEDVDDLTCEVSIQARNPEMIID